jgi:hypothetical protein
MAKGHSENPQKRIFSWVDRVKLIGYHILPFETLRRKEIF